MEHIKITPAIAGPIELLPVNEQDRLFAIMREKLEAEIFAAFGFGHRPAPAAMQSCDRPCFIVHHPECRNAAP